MVEDGRSVECDALGEVAGFLRFFEDLSDPRQRGKVIYPLDEVLLLCLLAVLAGAETITDMARFGDRKLAFLRRFRPFMDRTPAHDHLGDNLASLDAETFQHCFVAWVSWLTGASIKAVGQNVIAIGGKTSRRSGRKAGPAPLHMVSAFAARQRLVLGQVAVAGNSNEIVAIPKLLAMLAIEGAVVTIDAMGCQRSIAQTIRDKKADYVLALKGNQGALRSDVDLFVSEQKPPASATPPSARLKRSRAITAASRSAPSPPSMTSRGSGNATPGRASPASSSSTAVARSARQVWIASRFETQSKL